MKKLLLPLVLLVLLDAFAALAAAQTTQTLASGGIGVSCNAVSTATSINPGLAGGCTSFNLLTSGGNLPVVYTWQTITTGSPSGLSVTLVGSLDGSTWTTIDTATSASTRTATGTAYRFLGCVPGTLSGGSSPTVTCQISVSSGTTGGGGGSGTVSPNNGSAGAVANYAAAGGSTTVGPDATLTDNGTNLTYSGTSGARIPDGTTSAPAYSFTGLTGGGMWRNGSTVTMQAASGNGLVSVTSGAVILNDGNNLSTFGSGVQTNAGRNLSETGAPAIIGTSSSNGQSYSIGAVHELITLNTAGTTTDSTNNLLPANSLILSVVARVTTTITTATNWSLGDATTSARFAAANTNLTAGTTSVGMQQMQGSVAADAAGPVQTTAAKLRITTSGTPGAGAIRVTVYYISFTPPTS